MSWSGTQNGNMYIGTYEVDGRVFMGTWTTKRAPSEHPFVKGAPTNDGEAHKQFWFGLWGEDKIWRGKYMDPADEFEFAGTMTG